MKIDTATCAIMGTEDVALSLLELPQAAAVLDLGCYKGSTSRALLTRGYQVSSCDLLEREGVEQLPNFRVVDANKPLPYKDKEFDGVLSTEVIEHLENPTQFIRECSRILKDDGVFVLSTPDVNNIVARITYLFSGEFPVFRPLHFFEWGHISPVSYSWLAATAQKYGFRIEAVASEKRPIGWKRKILSSFILVPLHPLFRRQGHARNLKTTIILRLRKTSEI